LIAGVDTYDPMTLLFCYTQLVKRRLPLIYSAIIVSILTLMAVKFPNP
jgi:hypothetical protein